MDADYLKENVGVPLAKGIAACVLQQPQDPVEFLALWLKQYVQTIQREQQVE